MNPVFWILVALGAVGLWFIISNFVFIPFGRMILRKWNKTIEVLNKEDDEEKEEVENE